MEKIRAIIVDDEKPARRRLRELLEKQPDIAIVAECSNGAEAVRKIRALQPDLLLLDIQMPGLDGFGVVDAIGAAQMPATIFVTAYDRYALKAFEVSALDYLLKPFSDERFERSLARVLSFVRTSRREELNHRILSLLDQIQPKQPNNTSDPLDCLMIKDGGRVLFLRVEEIDWIEGAGVYVQVHTAGKTWLHRISLSELEAKLDARQFLRIHRSTIVNLQKVRELHPHSHGDFLVVLHDGTELKLSRSYRQKVEASLGQSLYSSLD
ncbi:LytTR family DNA-binding domain-containing protein [candidate division KSB1 bacterium]|nr:LytTR family DNA-binding domain-containing protein [candidate division KSB1 bacterium]